eukprot:15313430-Alexandrium_andersonii.AAC.1
MCHARPLPGLVHHGVRPWRGSSFVDSVRLACVGGGPSHDWPAFGDALSATAWPFFARGGVRVDGSFGAGGRPLA